LLTLAAPTTNQEFFGSFFQKRTSFFLSRRTCERDHTPPSVALLQQQCDATERGGLAGRTGGAQCSERKCVMRDLSKLLLAAAIMVGGLHAHAYAYASPVATTTAAAADADDGVADAFRRVAKRLFRRIP
jgi:hypothetical protein